MTDRQAGLRRRPLGARSGIEVTEVGIGLWPVPNGDWGPGNDHDILDAIEAALEAGVDFFDTADVYGSGHSEELLGRAMKGRRSDFVVGTKIGWTGFDHEAFRSQYDTVEKLMAGVEGSLRRLDTDFVDLIQCHIHGEEPNTDVFIEGFKRLKEEGKVKAWGVSTGELSHLERFNAGGDCDALQIDYSILNRIPENEVLPYCQEHGIGVIVRGPLAMGLLTDKFSASDTFPEGDFRKAWVEDPEENEQFLVDLDTVSRLRAIVPAEDTMAQFSLRFVTTHPAVTTVIPGARNRRQAESNTVAGLRPPLSPEEMAGVSSVIPSGWGRKIWPA
jgi:aryl-alcohol dehydrogenase-like predicted oxidoreductase